MGLELRVVRWCALANWLEADHKQPLIDASSRGTGLREATHWLAHPLMSWRRVGIWCGSLWIRDVCDHHKVGWRLWLSVASTFIWSRGVARCLQPLLSCCSIRNTIFMLGISRSCENYDLFTSSHRLQAVTVGFPERLLITSFLLRQSVQCTARQRYG